MPPIPRSLSLTERSRLTSTVKNKATVLRSGVFSAKIGTSASKLTPMCVCTVGYVSMSAHDDVGVCECWTLLLFLGRNIGRAYISGYSSWELISKLPVPPFFFSALPLFPYFRHKPLSQQTIAHWILTGLHRCRAMLCWP